MLNYTFCTRLRHIRGKMSFKCTNSGTSCCKRCIYGGSCKSFSLKLLHIYLQMNMNTVAHSDQPKCVEGGGGSSGGVFGLRAQEQGLDLVENVPAIFKLIPKQTSVCLSVCLPVWAIQAGNSFGKPGKAEGSMWRLSQQSQRAG